MSAPAAVEVTRELDAPPSQVWALVTDVRRLPELAPALSDTQWAQGSSGPAVGAVFAGHVQLPAVLTVRRGLVRSPGQPRRDTWFYFRVTRCEPDRSFEFENVASRAVTATGYRLSPFGVDATAVTAYTRLPTGLLPSLVGAVLGGTRTRRHKQELRDRLGRIRALVEGAA